MFRTQNRSDNKKKTKWFFLLLSVFLFGIYFSLSPIFKTKIKAVTLGYTINTDYDAGEGAYFLNNIVIDDIDSCEKLAILDDTLHDAWQEVYNASYGANGSASTYDDKYSSDGVNGNWKGFDGHRTYINITANLDCSGVTINPISVDVSDFYSNDSSGATKDIMYDLYVDGHNHTISNLTISNSVNAESVTGDVHGLFSVVNSANFVNLKFSNVGVANVNAGTNALGVVVGEARDSNFNNIDLDNVTLNASVSDVGSVAGLCSECGFAGNDISNLNISSATYAGGLTANHENDGYVNGISQVKITSSTISGTYVGGLVSYNINHALIINNIMIKNTTISGTNAGGLGSYIFPTTVLVSFPNDSVLDNVTITGSSSAGVVSANGGVIDSSDSSYFEYQVTINGSDLNSGSEIYAINIGSDSDFNNNEIAFYLNNPKTDFWKYNYPKFSTPNIYLNGLLQMFAEGGSYFGTQLVDISADNGLAAGTLWLLSTNRSSFDNNSIPSFEPYFDYDVDNYNGSVIAHELAWNPDEITWVDLSSDDGLISDSRLPVISLSDFNTTGHSLADPTINRSNHYVKFAYTSQTVYKASTDTTTITVSLANAKSYPVRFHYSIDTNNSTAVLNTDYSITNAATDGTGYYYLDFAAGETSKTINISLLDNGLAGTGATRTVVFKAQNPVNALLGENDGTALTIDYSSGGGATTNSNSQPNVQFGVTSSSVTEDGNSTDITVSLSQAYASTVTVDYSVTGGTATNGTDYSLSSGTLSFPAYTTSQTITVDITDDSNNESDETIIISLSNPLNASLGTDDTYTLTITDNDGSSSPSTPNVYFETSTSTVSEASNSTTIKVKLSDTYSSTVTVDYSVTGGTATNGTDYSLSSGTLSFPAYSTEQEITVSITNDTDDESDETVEITINNPVNASLTSPYTHTLTIVDDDEAGPESLPRAQVDHQFYLNSYVNDIEVDSSNNAYISGAFSSVQYVANDYAVFEKPGTGKDFIDTQATPQKHAGYSSRRTIFISDNNGGQYAFSNEYWRDHSGNYNYKLVHIYANGYLDRDFGANFSSQYVNDLAVDDNYVYIAIDGTASSINGGSESRSYLFRVNKSTGALDSWQPSLNSNVKYLEIYNDGTDKYLILAGSFSSVDSNTRHYLAAYDISGSTPSLSAWDPSPNSYTFYDLKVNDNYVYVLGAFTSIGGESRKYAAKLNMNSSSMVESWNPNPNSYPYALAFDSSYVYIGGGSMSELGGDSLSAPLGRVDKTNGNLDTSWTPYIYSGSKLKLMYIKDSILYLAGVTKVGKTSSDYVSTSYLGAYDLTNDTYLDWTPYVGSYYLSSLYVDDNYVYLSGYIEYAGKIEPTTGKRMVLKINSNGNIDNTFFVDVGSSSYFHIYDTALSPDESKLYLAGYFNKINGTTAYGLVRVDTSDGSLDTTWLPNVKYSSTSSARVGAVEVDSDYVYAGGGYIYYVGSDSISNHTGIVAIGVSDANYKSWNPAVNWSYPSSESYQYNSLNKKGNYLIVAGNFTSINGNTRRGLALFDVSDSNPSNWTLNNDWKPYLWKDTSTAKVWRTRLYDDKLFVLGYYVNKITNGSDTTIVHDAFAYDISDSNPSNWSLTDWNPRLNKTSNDQYIARDVVKIGDTVYFGNDYSNLDGVSVNDLVASRYSDGAIANWQYNFGSASYENPYTIFSLAKNSDGSKIYIGAYYSFQIIDTPSSLTYPETTVNKVGTVTADSSGNIDFTAISTSDNITIDESSATATVNGSAFSGDIDINFKMHPDSSLIPSGSDPINRYETVLLEFDTGTSTTVNLDKTIGITVPLTDYLGDIADTEDSASEEYIDVWMYSGGTWTHLTRGTDYSVDATNGKITIYTNHFSYFVIGPAVRLAVVDKNPEEGESTTVCDLEINQPYKEPNSPGVYYITNKCTRRAFNNPTTYFSYFDSWSDVKVVSKDELEKIPMDAIQFMPYGPKKELKNGSLIKTFTKKTVYLIVDDYRYAFATEKIFKTLGYSFKWVLDVAEELLDKFRDGKIIENVEDVPEGMIYKYSDSNKVYMIRGEKKEDKKSEHFKSFTELKDRLNYDVNHIPTPDKDIINF